jgi:membrane associated rhomboid family serine protease
MMNLPFITKNLLIINVIIFIASRIGSIEMAMHEHLDMYYFPGDHFKPWQLVTYMFMHANVNHLFGNMLGLLLCGPYLESRWNPKKFLNFYLMCGVGAGISFQVMLYLQHTSALYPVSMLGASGAIFGLLFAFGALNPNAQVMLLFPPIPMRAIVLVSLLTLYEIYMLWRNDPEDHVAHFAHIAGLVVSAIILFVWKQQKKLYS